MLDRFDGTPCVPLSGESWVAPEQMPQGLDFVKRLLADPTDDVTRCVFADWLEEQGTPSVTDDLRAPGRLVVNRNGWLAWRPAGRIHPEDYRDYWLAPNAWNAPMVKCGGRCSVDPDQKCGTNVALELTSLGWLCRKCAEVLASEKVLEPK